MTIEDAKEIAVGVAVKRFSKRWHRRLRCAGISVHYVWEVAHFFLTTIDLKNEDGWNAVQTCEFIKKRIYGEIYRFFINEIGYGSYFREKRTLTTNLPDFMMDSIRDKRASLSEAYDRKEIVSFIKELSRQELTKRQQDVLSYVLDGSDCSIKYVGENGITRRSGFTAPLNIAIAKIAPRIQERFPSYVEGKPHTFFNGVRQSKPRNKDEERMRALYERIPDGRSFFAKEVINHGDNLASRIFHLLIARGAIVPALKKNAAGKNFPAFKKVTIKWDF